MNNEFVVGVPIEEAWKAMLDLERIAPCLPGASIDDHRAATSTRARCA
jgi:carbon monoxide dehydrogenase subunit G